MSDPATFLRAIRADPDDDGPRLVYADWLEEHGDSDRAEFVRIQCEIARLSPKDLRWRDLVLRERRLLTTYRAAWRAEWPRLRGVTWGELRRGFVDEVRFATVKAFEDHADRVLDVAPMAWVQFGWPSAQSIRRLVRCPTLARVTGLSFCNGWIRTDGLRELAASAPLPVLKRLDLELCGLAADAAPILAEMRFAPHLESLNVSGNDLGRLGATAVARSTTLTGLRELNFLSAAHVRTEAAAGDSTAYSAMPRLRVAHADWETNELAALGSGPLGRTLEVLSLDGPDLSAEAFATWPVPNRLRCLWLHTRPAEAAVLAQSPPLAGLTDLTAIGCPATTQALRELAASPYLHRLERLDLSGSSPQGPGLEALLASPVVGRLKVLNLDGIEWSKSFAAVLAGASSLSGLEDLDLGGNRLGSEGVRALAESPHLTNLHRLGLGSTGLGDAVADVLIGTDGWRQLRFLDLAGNPSIGPLRRRRLRARYGDAVRL